MSVNKIIFGGSPLIDLTSDSVRPDTLLTGITAHAANGQLMVGTMSGVAVLDAYPVGSTYESILPTNPANYFGGVWASYGAGKVLVGVDPDDADFEIVESTGGEKEHVLTTEELPSHNHTQTAHSHQLDGTANKVKSKSSGGYNRICSWSGSAYVTLSTVTPAINSTGGGMAHNNMQAYITVYRWKRIQ